MYAVRVSPVTSTSQKDSNQTATLRCSIQISFLDAGNGLFIFVVSLGGVGFILNRPAPLMNAANSRRATLHTQHENRRGHRRVQLRREHNLSRSAASMMSHA